MPNSTDLTHTQAYVLVIQVSEERDPSDTFSIFSPTFALYKRTNVTAPSSEVTSYGERISQRLKEWFENPTVQAKMHSTVMKKGLDASEIEKRLKTSFVQETNAYQQTTDPGEVDTRGLSDTQVEILLQSGYEKVKDFD